MTKCLLCKTNETKDGHMMCDECRFCKSNGDTSDNERAHNRMIAWGGM